MKNYSLPMLRHCEEQRSEAIHKDFPGWTQPSLRSCFALRAHCMRQKYSPRFALFARIFSSRRFAPRNDGAQETSSYGFSSNEKQVSTR